MMPVHVAGRHDLFVCLKNTVPFRGGKVEITDTAVDVSEGSAWYRDDNVPVE